MSLPLTDLLPSVSALPLVSIHVPNVNHGRFICRTLESILAQD